MAKEFSKPPGGRISKRDIGDLVQETCVKKMMENPGLMCLALTVQDSVKEEAAEFLRNLIANLSPEWWKQQKISQRQKILDNLIKIDNQRGIIAGWLAGIIREESDWKVLKTAGAWQPQEGN